jgi:CRP-like cAMP-binding protein
VKPRLFDGCEASPQAFSLHVIRAGATLFTGGAAASDVIIILSGSVELARTFDRPLRIAERFGDGDALGLEALFARSYGETATALQMTLFWRIPAAALRRLAAAEPAIALNVARIAHERLERMRAILPAIESAN